MPWDEIRLDVDREQLPLAEAALEAEGALAVTLLDPAAEPVLEPEPGETPLWPHVEVRALFPEHTDRGGVVAALARLPGFTGEGAAWRRVEDREWERVWMERLRPMRFGRNLWIVPTGMEPSDEGGTILRLDPGLAFGTGTHPTTALCLEWIDGHDFAGRRVLDYGCGSGVLGIATALKGAAAVIAVDNDPQALTATAANAGRNGVADRVGCVSAETFSRAEVDVVLANILAAPLIELAPRLGACLAPGGHIVLSGILTEQAEAVEDAYRRFVGQMRVIEREGWVRLDGTAPGRAAEPS